MRVVSRYTRRTSKALAPASSALAVWLGSVELAKALRPHMAKVYWDEIVGEQVAAVTQVASVRDGVLTVRVKNSPWCVELTLLREDMIRRLNLKLGGWVIKDIKFDGTGLHPPPPEPVTQEPVLPTAEALAGVLPSPEALARAHATVQGIKDEALRERLRATLLRVSRLEAWKRDNGWQPCGRCAALVPPPASFCSVCSVLGRYPDRRQQRD